MKSEEMREGIPVEKIEVPEKVYREDNVDYFNEGRIKGVLAREPQLVSDNLLILTILTRDEQVRNVPTNGKGYSTRKKLYHFPTFTVVGKKAPVYAKHLKKGQVVELTYKLETWKKPDKKQPGKSNYYASQLVLDLYAGKVLEGEELPFILDK